MASSLHFSGGLLFAALVLSPGLPRDHTAELHARFQRETNSVHKAELMQKLGTVEFHEIERDVTNRQFHDALQILDQYRSEVEQCSKELDHANIDPVKKPSGFKQLQISVREALERIDRLISTMTSDDQLQFRHDRDDLERLNSHLIQELFPRERPRHNYHHIPIP
ncbi:MAG: hypothetical protein ACRD4X_09240 [Candidatus Acidiferrales bacterium]